MVTTRGSSRPQPETRRSKVSVPKNKSKRQKKFDFIVFDQKLASLNKKIKTAVQLAQLIMKCKVTTKDYKKEK